jgi:predicted PurR-regulated permease PerM
MNQQKPSNHLNTILALFVLSIGVMVWLFMPFISALFVAVLISAISYSPYQKLQLKFSPRQSALIMTLVITIIIIFPISYLLIIGGLEISILINKINQSFELGQVERIIHTKITDLNIPESIKSTLLASLENNLSSTLISIKNFSITMLKSIASLSSDFFLFLLVMLFSLYHLYIDGRFVLSKLKIISPLPPLLTNQFIGQFTTLSVGLVGSVVMIAIIQGFAFSICMMIVGLPALYFGIAMALASFIPIVGGLVVWLPLSFYLYATGDNVGALIVMFFGVFIVGFIIDNIVRPIVTKRLFAKSEECATLGHSLITVLSTLAGIMHFGVLGLVFGPMIAAIAISVFNTYIIYLSPTRKNA